MSVWLAFGVTLLSLRPDAAAATGEAADLIIAWRPAPAASAADFKLIALPPGSRPSLEILALEQRDEAPGSRAVPAAPAPAELHLIGAVRGVALARLTLYPVQRTSAGLRFTTYLRVGIRYNVDDQPGTPAAPLADPLLEHLRTLVVNPDVVQSPASSLSLSDLAASTPSPTALIEVDTPGLTAITHAALAAAGFPVDAVDPARLRLERAGADVALEWDGDPDAQFEPGERLLFYAAPRFNRYTARDVYRLSEGAAPGLRLAARAAVPGPGSPAPAWAETVWEQNTLYTPGSCRCPPGRDGDRWMWDYLSGPGGVRQYTLTLPPLDPAQPATLTLWFLGFTKTAHRAEAAVNGVPVGAAEWTGQQVYTLTAPVAAGVLAAGANTLTLTVPGVDGLWLDAVSLRYSADLTAPAPAWRFATRSELQTGPAPAPGGPERLFLPLVTRSFTPVVAYAARLSGPGPFRAYDLTDPDRPLRVTDVTVAGDTLGFNALNDLARRYLVVSEAGIGAPAAVRAPHALSGAAGADYLIITHPDFLPALGPLTALRQAQGFTVAVEDVRAVYDAADGRPTPDAIRAFIAGRAPLPQYVLLVGDGAYDPRRYRADSQPTFLPPFLDDVDPWLGEAAADNRYAAVDGDRLPDVALGRLPVNTLAEAQAVVAKLVQYETAPPAGDWNRRVVFVADDFDGVNDFAGQADGWAAAVMAPRVVERVYHAPATPITDTRQAITDQWNQGASALVYNGHSTPRQWGAERFFHRDDAGALSNAGRLPIVLQMTCLTGAFQDAALSTLDESLLRQPGGGAVGVWGASGFGVATGHDQLAAEFLRQVYVLGQPRAGLAALSAKLQLNPLQADDAALIETFAWLGDPATVIHLALDP